MENIIEIKGLTKTYKKNKKKAVDNLSLRVLKGEIFGLLGPNGSGKSTTINSILSLLNYEKGDIKVFGDKMDVNSYDIKKRIGVVFQDIAVFDELNVYENVDFFCGLYVDDKKEREKCVKEALKLVGLDKYTKYKPKELSGGLLRRLNIACGIAHKPELIFLDEPTVGVDPQSRNRILENIKELNKKGATVVYTSHYMEEIEELCNYIIVLDKGKVIASGTVDELKEGINVDEKITVIAKGLTKGVINKVKKLNKVTEVTYDGKSLHVKYSKNNNNLKEMIKFLEDNNIIYEKIFSELPTLNDVFLELTGKDLRD